MDHGRVGPPGAKGGAEGAANRVTVIREGQRFTPEHLSKDQGIAIKAGDSVAVSTPGGGGFGDPFDRPVELVERDLRRGYYSLGEAEALFGVVADPETRVADAVATMLRRSKKRP